MALSPSVRTAVALVGLSLLVHLPGITSPLLDLHSHRQCQTAMVARNYVENGYRFLYPQIDWEGRSGRAGTELVVASMAMAWTLTCGRTVAAHRQHPG